MSASASRPWGARLGVVLLAALAVVVGALAGPALAHVGGGAAGSDFDGRVTSVSPPLPGLSVRVLDFGDTLEVVNETGTEVAVPGYNDEPYLRIGPDGVWRNALSPASYLNLDRYGRAPVPDDVDVTAPPRWEQVSTEPQYVWHDHRTHWMSEGLLPPAVAADPTRTHTVAEWTVPMAVGGTPVVVAGELTWSPPPPAWLVWPVYGLLLAATVLAGWRAGTPRPLAVALGAGGLAALVHALATPDPPVTVASYPGALVSALLPALLAVLVAAIGIRAALRGRGVLTGLMAVVGGWLLLVQGVPDVDVLWTAHTVTRGPELLGRAAVAVLVVVGLGLVIGGALAARRFRDDVRGRPAADTPVPAPVGG
ncbi:MULTISPECIES: hypothetical protein [unclassified Modestobacter]